MWVTTYNKLNLEPIGKVRFKFSRKFPRNTNTQFVYIGDVEILDNTDRYLDDENYKAIMKLMKDSGSDLLTDGVKFFTTRGQILTEIKHGGFKSVLEIHKAGVTNE
jgi:hypothetical protein